MVVVSIPGAWICRKVLNDPLAKRRLVPWASRGAKKTSETPSVFLAHVSSLVWPACGVLQAEGTMHGSIQDTGSVAKGRGWHQRAPWVSGELRATRPRQVCDTVVL